MLDKTRHCASPIRHSDEGRNLLLFIYKIPTFVGMTLLLLFSLPAHAQEKDLSDIIAEAVLPEGAIRHAPENCDFEVTFPSKPYTAKRCLNGVKNCTKLTSYTMVYDITTTIELSFTCVPSTPKQYKTYTKDVINTALRGMISRAEIEEHEINTIEEGGLRKGSLLGSTKRGKQNSIYNAQLWIGQDSIMTLEAKLIGPYHSEADTVFSGILASVKKQED